MLLEGAHETVIEEMKDIVYDHSGYRADIASMLTSRLVNYALYHAETNPIDQKTLDRISELIKADDIFNNDLKYIIAKRLFNGNKAKFQKLTFIPEVAELIMK
jgi:hypothetical protein